MAAVSDDNSIGQQRAARFQYHRPRRGAWLQVFDVWGWEWNAIELNIPDLPAKMDGTRLLHLGDIHLRSRWPAALEGVIDRVNSDPPDLILFTGDFVEDKRDHGPALPALRRLIEPLQSKSGRFAILGNHDGDLLLPRLTALGVRVIVHQRLEVPVRGGTVELIGFPGLDRLDLSDAFLKSIPKRGPGVPRIILSHYPDLIRAADAAGLAPDLYLAGHTHGGQICLPDETPIMRHDSLPRRLCKGAHDYRGTCLVVTRGLGFTGIPVRAFCPGEATEIVLRGTLK